MPDDRAIGPLPMSLLMKLGSLVVHVQEMDPAKGLDFDLPTAKALAADPEVVTWLETIDPAMLPVKR